MEEFLIVLLQFLLEFFFNVLINLPFDWPSRGRRTPESKKLVGVCFILFCMGCAVAWGSLFFFHASFISIPELRLLNLAIAPIAAAYISQCLAKAYAKTNNYIFPRNHFWQAFWFTVGFVAVRFVYTAHAMA